MNGCSNTYESFFFLTPKRCKRTLKKNTHTHCVFLPVNAPKIARFVPFFVENVVITKKVCIKIK